MLINTEDVFDRYCLCTLDEFESSDKKEVIKYINSSIEYRIKNMENRKPYYERHLENVYKEIDVELALLLKDSDVEINR